MTDVVLSPEQAKTVILALQAEIEHLKARIEHLEEHERWHVQHDHDRQS